MVLESNVEVICRDGNFWSSCPGPIRDTSGDGVMHPQPFLMVALDTSRTIAASWSVGPASIMTLLGRCWKTGPMDGDLVIFVALLWQRMKNGESTLMHAECEIPFNHNRFLWLCFDYFCSFLSIYESLSSFSCVYVTAKTYDQLSCIIPTIY